MGLSFRKRKSLGGGSTATFTNKGIGISTGVKGMRFGVNSSGYQHFSLSIPGTGIRFTRYSRRGKGPIALIVGFTVWFMVAMLELAAIFTYWGFYLVLLCFKWFFLGLLWCVRKFIGLFRKGTNENV